MEISEKQILTNPPGINRGFGQARIRFLRESGNNPESEVQTGEQYRLRHKASFLANRDLDSPEYFLFCKLLEAERDGGVCITIESTKDTLKRNFPDFDLKHTNNPHLYSNEKYIYLKSLHRVEEEIYLSVREFFDSSDSDFILKSKEVIREKQIDAVELSLKKAFSLITGGPGTGKTTTLKSIVQNLIANGVQPEKILLTAPTGKAAKRISESIQSLITEFGITPPMTLHRLLKFHGGTGKFNYNSDNPLPADVVIVDECSMVDVHLANALFSAHRPKESQNKKLILIGDPDQLLSVNPGTFFSDLVRIGKNLVTLEMNFRQSSDSGKEIKNLAEAIQKNIIFDIKPFKREDLSPKLTGGIQWLEFKKNDYKEIIRAWSEQFQDDSYQILVPYNHGRAGIHEINSLFLKNERQTVEHKSILTKNITRLDLFNGDMGILSLSGDGYKFQPSGKNEFIDIPGGYSGFFQPAFAITIHKSQGSEFNHVLLVLPDEAENRKDSLLNKRLIYTGITRAKISLTILSSEQTWNKSIMNLGIERISGLKDRF
ncbi:MAG: AAA family ATPase [Leptospiraceae bacterium]|nr:AAA family ATPase [Leptospiraceae bacterium]MCP5510956.1 AAA family ATPase [Leptospiraceae bacterium]